MRCAALHCNALSLCQCLTYQLAPLPQTPPPFSTVLGPMHVSPVFPHRVLDRFLTHLPASSRSASLALSACYRPTLLRTRAPAPQRIGSSRAFKNPAPEQRYLRSNVGVRYVRGADLLLPAGAIFFCLAWKFLPFVLDACSGLVIFSLSRLQISPRGRERGKPALEQARSSEEMKTAQGSGRDGVAGQERWAEGLRLVACGIEFLVGRSCCFSRLPFGIILALDSVLRRDIPDLSFLHQNGELKLYPMMRAQGSGTASTWRLSPPMMEAALLLSLDGGRYEMAQIAVLAPLMQAALWDSTKTVDSRRGLSIPCWFSPTFELPCPAGIS